jgi:hypothetical protein
MAFTIAMEKPATSQGKAQTPGLVFSKGHVSAEAATIVSFGLLIIDERNSPN